MLPIQTVTSRGFWKREEENLLDEISPRSRLLVLTKKWHIIFGDTHWKSQMFNLVYGYFLKSQGLSYESHILWSCLSVNIIRPTEQTSLTRY